MAEEEEEEEQGDQGVLTHLLLLENDISSYLKMTFPLPGNKDMLTKYWEGIMLCVGIIFMQKTILLTEASSDL